MLRDIDGAYSRSIIHIAGREYRVKYSLNALLYLEVEYKPLEELTKQESWSRTDIIHLCRAALCSVSDNLTAVRARDFDSVRPSAAELDGLIDNNDLPLMGFEIMTAILNSLPAPEADENKDEAAKVMNEGHLRALYVDELHRPENEFWESTKKEILSRADYYLEVKGLKEAPTRVKRYADE